MNELHETIRNLSDTQVNAFLELAAQRIEREQELQVFPLEALPPEDPGLNRSLLLLICQGEDELAGYLRRQLKENAPFLREQGTLRDGLSSALPFLAVILPFLKAKLELSRRDGRFQFSFSAEWRSLTDLLEAFGRASSRKKNTVEGSQITVFGNLHIGGNIIHALKDPTNPDDSGVSQNEIEKLLHRPDAERIFERILEALDGIEEGRYQEALQLFERLGDLKKKERQEDMKTKSV